ncbi:MAG TPA: patatin-like phospholipase family protein, partial [Planctomycetota bacterium]|nr:patatin-like phospholipase family protein [Planctomycetota bacterium]
MPDTDYSKASRNCDVVMKGGITSGLVYPAAVCRLAAEYRFRSIGGTSAGAIAAAATAAAEYGRRTGKGTSFKELETLPSLLAGPRLFKLFQPQPQTENLFQTLTAGLRGARGVLPFLGAAVRQYLPFALLGAAPILFFVAPAFSLATLFFVGFFAAVFSWIPWLLLAAVGAAVGVALAVLQDLRKKVPANFFGLCTGMGSDEALTPWLHDLLQRLSGKPKEEPLTFGDLWGDDPSKREVDLQMMTTSLTFGRPSRLPFPPEEERLYFFKREEMEKLFPKPVVDWMCAKARPESCQAGFSPLPPMRDLPVIVAMRMSLSFPLLIGAVPLHAVDADSGATVPEPVWFSDGGIASNFPVHFFDSPLPGWPTFAIN